MQPSGNSGSKNGSKNGNNNGGGNNGGGRYRPSAGGAMAGPGDASYMHKPRPRPPERHQMLLKSPNVTLPLHVFIHKVGRLLKPYLVSSTAHLDTELLYGACLRRQPIR